MYRRNISDEKKSVVKPIRVSSALYEKIDRKAKQTNQSVNKFIINCMEAGVARKGKYDKYKTRFMVEAQENLNQLIRNLEPEQEDVKKQLIEYTERTMELWDN